ncbi:MAG: TetR/AcrR family transcriptional regulator [Ignavibacteriales bacterium]|nr:TetR/AcrR family transcriptional regulator [Ignavibacteriales bacterium]
MANERKIQIIKAAAKRFARHGLAKTTLDEVARDIRIGKATIYHYFTSKDDLYFATLKWECELFIEQVKTFSRMKQANNHTKIILFTSN